MKLNAPITALTLGAVLSTAVVAQNVTGSSNYTTGLVAALNGANLTTLATLLEGYPALGSALQTSNFTVRCPCFTISKEPHFLLSVKKGLECESNLIFTYFSCTRSLLHQMLHLLLYWLPRRALH